MEDENIIYTKRILVLFPVSLEGYFIEAYAQLFLPVVLPFSLCGSCLYCIINDPEEDSVLLESFTGKHFDAVIGMNSILPLAEWFISWFFYSTKWYCHSLFYMWVISVYIFFVEFVKFNNDM